MRGLLMAAAVCLASSSTAAAQQDLPGRIEAVRDGIVSIVTYDRDGTVLGTGSGFFVAPTGHLVTNRHVMEGAFRAEAVLADGTRLTVESLLGSDQHADLAILDAKILGPAPLLIRPAAEKSRAGESVFVVGAPFGLEASASTGIVAAIRQVPPYGEMIQITAPISPGSSGSPVMNQKGEVIGIATMGIVQGQNLNFAVPVSRVHDVPLNRPVSIASWGARTRRSKPPAPAILGLRGSRVRIAAAGLGAERLAGMAVSVRGDTLVFKPDALTARLYIPASTINSLEVSRGHKHLGPLGAILGGLSLGYFGWKLGWDNTLGIDCKNEALGCEYTPAERGVQGAALLGGLGAGFGWLVGSEVGFERWRSWNVGGLR